MVIPEWRAIPTLYLNTGVPKSLLIMLKLEVMSLFTYLSVRLLTVTYEQCWLVAEWGEEIARDQSWWLPTGLSNIHVVMKFVIDTDVSQRRMRVKICLNKVT